MTIDLSKAPYLDRFKPSNQWTRINFLGDRSLQASELNEAQTILHHYMGRLGDSIMTDGDIQSGMDYYLDGDNNIVVEDGEVYFDGKVRQFNKSRIPFDEEAESFVLCVGLNAEIITEEDDDRLLDQNTGTPNYFSPGAHRMKETMFLTSDESEGVPIYEFRFGDLHLNKPMNRELSKINEILAERTFDESGSYRVRGFDIYSEEHPTNENLVNIVVDSGRAYVLGYQVDKPTPTRVAVPKAQEKREILSEAFIYDTQTRRGRLGNTPVAEVKRVTAQVQITRERVSKGPTGASMDGLAHSSVAKIDKVWSEVDGSETATYTQGRDFQLRNGNSIEWISGGNEPVSGGSYYVNYVYNRTMKKDTDYKVVTEGTVDNLASFVDFGGLTGAKPVVNSTVLVDYDYFLAREDLLILNKEGEVNVVEGQYESLERVKRPSMDDPFSLKLGSILIYPNSTTTIPTKSTVSNLTMQELQNLRNRVVNLEYNQALNALDQPAMQDVNPLLLRGVFSDGFISMSKYDRSHPDARIGFSFEDAEITLPYKSAHKKKPSYIAGASDAHIWGRLVTAPFDEEKSISQSKVTEAMNINPYNVFNNRVEFKLDPSEDSWVDEDRVTVVDTVDAGILEVHQWWRHPNANWVADEKERQANIHLDDNVDWGDVDSSTHGTRLPVPGWQWSTDLTTSQMISGGERTKESIIEYMRQIDVNFSGKNLTPNSNNLKLYFDGQLVAITPASGFSRGTESGTIRSNSSGEVKGSFKIPAGVRTGTREVMLENSDNIGLSTFMAEGRKKTVEDVIIRKRQTVHLVDPLAQSFQFRENKVVTSFEVYFASKDNTKNVGVQVRGISEGGQPNKTVYAETTLTPSQIKVSADGSTPTKIAFDDPLVVESGKEYALVLMTNSDQYTVWIGTRGGIDMTSGDRVTSNPYVEGVLYSSSNASAWTIHQDSDMKFNVYTARFNPEAVVVFDDMEDVSADAILLMATALTPDNTGSIWDVKMVMDNEPEGTSLADKEWVAIMNYEQRDLSGMARRLKLRATFKSNRNMSPIMSLNDLLLVSFLSELHGSYVSRTIDTHEAPYNNVMLSIENFTPGNSSVTPRYSTDGGDTWNEFTVQPTVTAQTDEFNRYVYQEKITDSDVGYDSIKFRLDMTTQNSFVRPRSRRLMTRWTME